MKKFTMFILAAALYFCFTGLAAAADTATQTFDLTVSEICLIDVTGNPASLTIVAPTTGGETPANPADSSTYAQYTSTVASGLTRKITANWGGTDSAPAGTSLKLLATPSGGTNEGSSAGQITVSSTAADVVTAIGSCATGTGATDGARLKYTLSVDTMTSLVANETENVTMTLTLTDAA
jgi:hypothetical protein